MAPGRVVRAPLGSLGTVSSQAGTLIGTQRPILIQNDKAASTLQTTMPAGRSGGVIDLTDEDEGEDTVREAGGDSNDLMIASHDHNI